MLFVKYPELVNARVLSPQHLCNYQAFYTQKWPLCNGFLGYSQYLQVSSLFWILNKKYIDRKILYYIIHMYMITFLLCSGCSRLVEANVIDLGTR